MPRFPYPFLVTALFLGACRSPIPITGDWVGDLPHPAMTLPLEVAIDGGSAKVSFRIWELREAPGQVALEGARFQVTVPAGLDTVRLDGTVSENRWVGTASRGQESVQFELHHLADLPDSAWAALAGSYRTEDGRLIGIDHFSEFGNRPFLVDYQSGRIGPLLPLSPTRFLLGHSLVAPIFPADTVELVRADNGAVSGLRVLTAAGPAREASRLRTRDEETSFDNGPVRLAGTLTLPSGSGPFPAIVLVHGSNAQTRQAMGPWVRYFAALGFATLAYDKRGTGGSAGDWQQADFPTLAGDAAAAVRALAARPDIRAGRIGLWGISQAGWIMPLVANALPDQVAFMVVHAGTGTTPREQGMLNYRNELRFAGVPEMGVSLGIEYHALDDAVTTTGKGFDRLQSFYDAHRAEAPWLYQPAPPDAWFRTYYRMLIDYDPAPTWAKISCPVLLFFGKLDANVPPEESWPPIERGLAAAGNRDVEHYVLPSANHVFLEARTGGRDEYPGLQRFVPGYFDRMATWLVRFTAP